MIHLNIKNIITIFITLIVLPATVFSQTFSKDSAEILKLNYQEINVKEISGAANFISCDEFNISTNNDLFEAIQGKIAGVDVSK